MKTGRSEVKAPISLSSKLGVSSGSEEEEDGWGREMKLMTKVYFVQVCSLKTTTVKIGFDAQKYLKLAHVV